MISLKINSKQVKITEGSTVAVAVLAANVQYFRKSVTGQARFPVCGMGICFECRVTINGVKHQRSCQILAENGMEIETDE